MKKLRSNTEMILNNIERDSLESDLINAEWIIEKVQNETYAQNLYAALCNNRFVKNKHDWSCTWRYAGGIVADLRWLYNNSSDNYTRWYCSGVWDDGKEGTVTEGTITEEIMLDLTKLGWSVL